MKIITIKTRIAKPPKDDLYEILSESLSGKNLEKSVIVITSKLISICEGRTELKSNWKNKKDELIKRESELFLPRKKAKPRSIMHTFVGGFLKPSSGIDSSNSGNYYVLLPENSFKTAKNIYFWMKKKYDLKEFGIIISDSHSVFNIRGSIGQCLGFYGFNPLSDYRKEKDLFGNVIKVSVSNIAESLAVSAVLSMGEGREQTPISIISDILNIKFIEQDFAKEYLVNFKDDYYFSFFKKIPWKKGDKYNNMKK